MGFMKDCPPWLYGITKHSHNTFPMPPTSTSHHAQVGPLRIHYTEAGPADAPPVLLIHGFPTSSHLWRNILPVLAKTHRAIAVDLPGYGLSDKPLDASYDFDFFADVLDGFVDALGIARTDLVVHDLGGPVGVYWALRRPERIQRLVLLNTLLYPETSWAVKLFLLAMKTPGLRDFIVSQKGIVGAMQFGVVDTGHFLQEDAPEQVAALIADFLGRD